MNFFQYSPMRKFSVFFLLVFFFKSGISWSASLGSMVNIPAGEFTMGWEGVSNKTPHKVFLDSYFIDIHEVTQEEYVEVMKDNPSKFQNPNLPVDQVTWFEAQAYCSKIGKRLPTEAEWEKAIRGGSVSLHFWENDEPGDYAWFDDNADDKTHPVAKKLPNAFGLYDMAGNVWEWNSDWYDRNYYEESPLKNPKGPENGQDKVLRGGSWYSSIKHITSVTRYWSAPDVRNSNFGFRCAQSTSK